jgi:predicted Zn-dependent peptidase
VVLEEMSMYYESPEDAIQDDFDEIVFQNHQLGRTILGINECSHLFLKWL